MSLTKKLTALMLAFLIIGTGILGIFVKRIDAVVSSGETYFLDEHRDDSFSFTDEYHLDLGVNGRIDDGEAFSLKLNWEFPDTILFTGDDSFVYLLPQGMILKNSSEETEFSGDMIQGVRITGLYDVGYDEDAGSSRIVFSFYEDFLKEEKKTAALSVKGTFRIVPDSEETIQIPGHGDVSVEIPESSQEFGDLSIMKKTSSRPQLGEDGCYYIDYTVTVNAYGTDHSNVTIWDTPDNNVVIDQSSIQFSGVEGEIETRSPEMNHSHYGYDYGDCSETDCLYWVIPKMAKDTSCTLTYRAKVINMSDSYGNIAYVYSDEFQFDYSNAVSSFQKPAISKEGKAAGGGESVVWTITVTFHDFKEVLVQETSQVIKDLMEESVNENASVTITYSDGSSQTITYKELEAGYTLQAEKGIDTAVIEFETKLPDGYSMNHNEIKNTVSLPDFEMSASGNVELISNQIQGKTGRDITPNAAEWPHGVSYEDFGKTAWTINFQFDKKPSELYGANPVFTDYIECYDSYGYETWISYLDPFYDFESFRITCPGCGGSSKVFTDCPHIYVESQFVSGGSGYGNWNPGFKLNFTEDAPAGDYVLEYDIRYDLSDWNIYSFGYNTEILIKNHMIAPNEEEVIEEAEVQTNYITKSGESDRNQITWRITFDRGFESKAYDGSDQDESDLIDVAAKQMILTDMIPEGLKVKEVRGSTYELENLTYEVDETENILTVTLPKAILKQGDYIEIITEYEDYRNLTTTQYFNNRAYITYGGVRYPDVEASASIRLEPFMSKTFTYNEDTAPYVEYTITVNPDGMDLILEADRYSIIDTMTGPQILDRSSLKVDGNLWSDYTWNGEKKILTIQGLTDEQIHRITYRTMVETMWGTGETIELTNDAFIEGTSIKAHAGKKEIIVEKPLGETSSLVKPVVMINKVDAVTEDVLKGAEFTVYDETGIVITTILTDENGEADFTLPESDKVYTLLETKAPEGYQCSAQRIKVGFSSEGNSFEDTSVVDLKGKAFCVFTVKNELTPKETSLTITKICEEAKPGEHFIMNVSDEEGNHIQVVVPANGSVNVEGLEVGKTYYVTEEEEWSWRYLPVISPASITLCEDREQNQVTVTNRKVNHQWLSGDVSCSNWWNETGNIVEITRNVIGNDVQTSRVIKFNDLERGQ